MNLYFDICQFRRGERTVPPTDSDVSKATTNYVGFITTNARQVGD